jgi:hypothetical protein
MSVAGKSSKEALRRARNLYWPPSKTSRVIALPGDRKKMFVFNGKSDREGLEQPVLCIASRGNERLAFFDKEEVAELRRIADRLHEYMSLWDIKAQRNSQQAAEEERRMIAAQDSIGVEI